MAPYGKNNKATDFTDLHCEREEGKGKRMIMTKKI